MERNVFSATPTLAAALTMSCAVPGELPHAKRVSDRTNARTVSARTVHLAGTSC